ncbi:MAG: NAD(P)H-hydrate dehydratase [Pseudohongiella sp.]|nr:NAD(P)H-hydrate dehydratase [Pseudohongiella sp.]MDP2128646.1 NAD(P)H-hydrate dehydratase [Pseudohongiella sp.]
MKALYTSNQVRRIDQQAIDCGISGYALMQRAAAAALRALAQRWPDARQLLIVCGAGNNGGDGYELARQASGAGWRVQVLYLKAPAGMTDDALTAANAALAEDVCCQPFSADAFTHCLQSGPEDSYVVVDAVLGIGFSGPLRTAYADAIVCINHCGHPVLAIDIPSGVDADTGYVDRLAIKADATLCVVARKQGLFTGDAPAFTGELLFDDLGLPSSVAASEPATTPSARGIDAGLLQHPGLTRSRTAHKGDSGHVLVIGGDQGFGGAAIMAAEAAARAGAGTVSLITRPMHVSAMLSRRPEVMVHGLDVWHGEPAERALALMARATVIVLGPGLGQSEWSANLLENVMSRAGRSQTPLVLDADALNMLAAQKTHWQELGALAARAQWIVTPHPAEAARLLGWSTEQVSQDRFAAVKALQHKTGAVCILKGAGSLLAFPGALVPVDICLEGNPGMASGGMGDVLAGICGAMLALGRSLTARQLSQGFDACVAARLAVCAHGEAADRAAAVTGERGLLATDLFSHLPVVLSGQSLLASTPARRVT